MIEADADRVNVTDQDGYTPLHRSSYNGHTPVIQVCEHVTYIKVVVIQWL